MLFNQLSAIESFESRTMLSAYMLGSTLHVDGSVLLANAIVVGNGAGGTISTSITTTTPKGVTKTVTKSFPATGIKKVVIVGGIKADNISIDESVSPFAIATRIEGRAGDDVITGGSEKDVIAGGIGNDSISAGAGNDLVHGGLGNDTLLGGDGNDTLWGGAGNDSIDGGNGDDKLGGVNGTNILHGAAGKDTFVIKAGGNSQADDYNSQEDTFTIKPAANDANEPPAA